MLSNSNFQFLKLLSLNELLNDVELFSLLQYCKWLKYGMKVVVIVLEFSVSTLH